MQSKFGQVAGFLVVLVTAAVAVAEDVDSAIAALAGDRPGVERLAAAQWLQDSTDPEAIRAFPALNEASRDADVDIRGEAVLALGILADRHAQSCPLALVEAMRDPSDLVRTNAAALVGLCQPVPDEAVSILLQCAADLNPEIRSAALMPLARCTAQKPLVRAVLRQANHDKDVLVRTNAAAALWKATEDLSQVVPFWLLLSEGAESFSADSRDERPMTPVSLAAYSAATMLRERGLAQPGEMSDVLVDLIGGQIPALRRAAVRNLRALAISSDDAKRVLIAKQIPELLQQMTSDPDAEVASMALLGLDEFREPAAAADEDSPAQP